MNFVLFIIAFVLVGSFSIIGILFMIFLSCLTLDKGFINDYFFKLAISLDQFGNVAMSGLFNTILIKPGKNPFGDANETISSVLGKNQKNGTLKFLGRRLVALLDKIEKNHSIKSIGT